MSLDITPAWCEVALDPALWMRAQCPDCHKSYFKAFSDRISECISGSYYTVAHIPPSIVLTCDNPECKSCDKDFSVNLFAVLRPTD